MGKPRQDRYNSRVIAVASAAANLPRGGAVPVIMSDTVLMDAHTLELLEFDKVRELLAGYAASSLG